MNSKTRGPQNQWVRALVEVVSSIAKMNAICVIEGHVSSGNFVKQLFSRKFEVLNLVPIKNVIWYDIHWIIGVDAINCQPLDASGVLMEVGLGNVYLLKYVSGLISIAILDIY